MSQVEVCGWDEAANMLADSVVLSIKEVGCCDIYEVSHPTEGTLQIGLCPALGGMIVMGEAAQHTTVPNPSNVIQFHRKVAEAQLRQQA